MNARKKYITSDLKKIDRMSNDAIDCSDIRELDEESLVQVDHDVVEYFKNRSKNYQALVNQVLRMYVNTVRHKNKLQNHKS